MSLSENATKNLISKVLGIDHELIRFQGSGTYSYVFSISDTQIIKVYHSEKSFREAHINDTNYFESAEFRESFFNPYLDHKNLLKYDDLRYHGELGLYKIAKRMMGSIDAYRITKNMNEKMFFRLLEDMTEGVKHLHSHGIIHSDIKPANVLFSVDDIGEYYFKICDFNISQFCSVVDRDVYSVFATENFSEKTSKRSIMTDIFMMGTTLLATILMKHNIVISNSQINSDVLAKYKSTVIKITNQICYDIIELMLLPQKHRIYIDDIKKFITKYKTHINDSKETISLVFDHKEDRFDKNNKEMQEACHERVRTHIRTLNQEELDTFKTLHGIFDLAPINSSSKTPSQHGGCKKKRKTEYTILHNLISEVLERHLNVSKIVAKFFSQSVCYYPKDVGVGDWTYDYKSPEHSDLIKDINTVARKLCMEGPYINCHLLLCDFCKVECETYRLSCCTSMNNQSSDANCSELNQNIKIECEDNTSVIKINVTETPVKYDVASVDDDTEMI